MPPGIEDFSYIRDFVRSRSAIVLDGKEYLIEARLETLAAGEGLPELTALMRVLRQENEPRPLHRKMVDALTTNETLFFRDVHPYEALRTRVLPELIESNRTSRFLRIWSAACSAGQEPLSLAMLLRQHFQQVADWRIELLATDLSDEMLEQARGGCYSQVEVNRGLPAHYLIRFFEDRGSHWQAASEIRRMIRYEHFNLIQPWKERAPFDLIPAAERHDLFRSGCEARNPHASVAIAGAWRLPVVRRGRNRGRDQRRFRNGADREDGFLPQEALRPKALGELTA
jgi:chemotaxis protein methyltransferase CheR